MEAIIAAAEDEDPELRAAAVNVWGKFKAGTEPDRLRTFLHDVDPSVRMAALRSLTAQNASEFQPELIASLRDPDGSVVNQAIYKLRDAGLLKVEGMAPLLKSENLEIRRSAAYWIGETGSEDACLPLKEALKDPDTVVRRHAKLALKRLGDKCQR